MDFSSPQSNTPRKNLKNICLSKKEISFAIHFKSNSLLRAIMKKRAERHKDILE